MWHICMYMSYVHYYRLGQYKTWLFKASLTGINGTLCHICSKTCDICDIDDGALPHTDASISFPRMYIIVRYVVAPYKKSPRAPHKKSASSKNRVFQKNWGIFSSNYLYKGQYPNPSSQDIWYIQISRGP